MKLSRLFDLLDYAKDKYAKSTALAGKISGKWIRYSSDDFSLRSMQIALALKHAGIRPGDRVVNISSNRPEWNFIDMGIQMAGAIHVPVFPVISTSDLKFILSETSARIVFAGNNFIYQKLKGVQEKVEKLERIIAYDKHSDAEDLAEFCRLEANDTDLAQIRSICEKIQTDDLATIIYTSGTSSNPKGVMLSHRNLISNFTTVAPGFKLQPSFSAVSYLPLCHVYERMLNYMYIYSGVSVYYAESLASITDNIMEVRPQVLTTVPLLLEKVYLGIRSKASLLEGKKQRVLENAIIHALKYPIHKRPGPLYLIRRHIYDHLVYRKWRAALGGRLTRIICGGAALQPSLLKVFWAAGIPVYEGYGLTETSPVISNNSNTANKLGTVGKILPHLDVKIASDGEIMVKGPSVMLGYYMLPQLTFETIDNDGYFSTGDVGEIVGDHFLKLTGRKKVLFKSSSGLYISPETIENRIKQSLFISQVMVVGADRSYLGALIVPDFNYILKWFEEKGIAFSDDAFLANHTLVIREIEKAIWDYNKDVFDSERIEKYKILTQEWTIDSGDLTPKLSLKRDHLMSKYMQEIRVFFPD